MVNAEGDTFETGVVFQRLSDGFVAVETNTRHVIFAEPSGRLKRRCIVLKAGDMVRIRMKDDSLTTGYVTEKL